MLIIITYNFNLFFLDAMNNDLVNNLHGKYFVFS